MENNLTVFEDYDIRRLYDEETETWFFSVVDIIQALTQQADYQTARKYWNKLKERLKKEGNQSVTNCRRLKFMAIDGKKYLKLLIDKPKQGNRMKKIIQTDQAPAAIGTYSQAVRVGNQIYISGQIPLDPKTMQVVSENIREQIHQVFKNLQAIISAAGGTFMDVVKLNVYLTDLSNFPLLNEIMSEYVESPYPARAAVQVSALPKGVQVEIDAVMILQD